MQALIIIDMQETPMSQDDKYARIAVIDRINKMASNIRDNSGKVIFIQHDGSKEEGLAPTALAGRFVRTYNWTMEIIYLEKRPTALFIAPGYSNT